MRLVIQRVRSAKVSVNGNIEGEINRGILAFLGITYSDTEKDIEYLCGKLLNLRIFEDENGKMNFSLLDTEGEVLVISQFTLYGDCRKGRRPSYDKAANPEFAEKMYEKFVESLKDKTLKVETGVFGADMKVEILNSGPVTLLLDSTKNF